jgi:hypothetical protein
MPPFGVGVAAPHMGMVALVLVMILVTVPVTRTKNVIENESENGGEVVRQDTKSMSIMHVITPSALPFSSTHHPLGPARSRLLVADTIAIGSVVEDVDININMTTSTITSAVIGMVMTENAQAALPNVRLPGITVANAVSPGL